MSGKHTKAYSDKTHFSVPSDAHEYSDEPHHQNGNGIYNDYTVDLQPKEYSSTFEIACFRFTNTRRTKCMLFGGLVTLCVFLIVIIAIASGLMKSSNPQAAPKPQAAPQPQAAPPMKSLGLVAYGPDAYGRINFDPAVSTTYMPIIHRIEQGMTDYSTVSQFAAHDKYISCDNNTTTVPDDKVCRYTAARFGDHCQQTNLYGCTQGRPCILLMLKLPADLKPIPLNFTDGQNNDVKIKIKERASSEDVGISCEGKTQDDKDLIIEDKHLGPVIDYNPTKGFPMFSFLARDHDGYVTPAAMIQFNSITTNHDITVKCTAWAENLKDAIYSTEFTFHLD